MAHKADHNVFLGSTIGSIKALKMDVKDGFWSSITKNLRKLDQNVLGKKQEVTAMEWGDKDENKIIVGHADQSVKVYDTEYGSCCESSVKENIGSGKICGVSSYNSALIMAVQSGHVHVCAQENKGEYVLETGGPIEKMKHSPISGTIIATGGKNKELQLWDLEAKKATFVAKNVRNDELDLQVPVWVSDIDFVPGSNRVVYCSRHGHVRVYDPEHQRRPVLNFCVPDKVLTACSVSPDGINIVVGAGDGYMGAVDVRGKGLLCHRYKGSVGSIRAVACHPTQPFVFSVGLDRHLKMHNLHSTKLLHKEYMKAQLNCVLVRTEFFYKHVEEEKVDSDVEITKVREIEESEEEEEEGTEKSEYNKLFRGMKKIIEAPAAKRVKIS